MKGHGYWLARYFPRLPPLHRRREVAPEAEARGRAVVVVLPPVVRRLQVVRRQRVVRRLQVVVVAVVLVPVVAAVLELLGHPRRLRRHLRLRHLQSTFVSRA